MITQRGILMKYFIGADLGTSSLKLILTDAEGRIINSVTKDYSVSNIQPVMLPVPVVPSETIE